jgi:hypothetical protein
MCKADNNHSASNFTCSGERLKVIIHLQTYSEWVIGIIGKSNIKSLSSGVWNLLGLQLESSVKFELKYIRGNKKRARH